MRLLLAALTALPLLGHDTYLLPDKFVAQPGEPVVLSLCSGDTFLESEAATNPVQIVLAHYGSNARITGWSAGDTTTTATIKAPESGSYYAVVSIRPQYSELEWEDFEAYLAEESLGHILAWRKKNNEEKKPGREMYSHYAKTLLVSGAPDKGWARVIGLPIEIVPDADPSSAQKDDSLPVRVLYRGRPLKGAVISAVWVNGNDRGSSVTAATDSAGRTKVQIDSTGHWKLHTIHMQRRADRSEADWESYWASFTFEVPQR